MVVVSAVSDLSSTHYNETTFQLLDAAKVEAQIVRFEEEIKQVPKSETVKHNLEISKLAREPSDP